MIALFDVNVLVALFDAAHVHHDRAQDWMSRHRSAGWATCPLTQNGCVRILSQPRYPGARPVPEVARRLRRVVAEKDHVFWPDNLSLCDPNRFHLEDVLSPRAVTDLYLLALATDRGGRLVTLDAGVSLKAVDGATAENVIVL